MASAEINQGRSMWLSATALWFGILGGPVAWLIHFVTAYTIAEFGCAGGSDHRMFAGITAVAWVLFGVTLVMLLVAVAGFVVAYRGYHASRRAADRAPAGSRFAAQTGLATSGLTAFFILVETIPIFYYLKDC